MRRVSPVRRSASLKLIPILALLTALTGCGSGLSRLSGKVTFGGKPIPVGKIYFTPKGNAGPTGYADIKDGAYDTAAGGMGVGKGPMVVAIEGTDPAAPKDKKANPHAEESVKPLFPRYETTTDLNGEPTKDFDVPADAGKPKPQTRPAGP